MKKYLPVIFLLIVWCASEAVSAPLRLVLVGGFFVIFALLLMRPRAVLWGTCLVLFAGACVYEIGFLRYLSVLLLTAAHSLVLKNENVKKNKKSGQAEFVYTVSLLAALAASGVLIRDIVFASHNPQPLVPVRQYWWMFGVVFCFVTLSAAGRAAARRRKDIAAVYAAGLFCALCAAAGFLCNSVRNTLNDAVFPWLLFLAAAAVRSDELLKTAVQNVLLTIGHFTAGKEGVV